MKKLCCMLLLICLLLSACAKQAEPQTQYTTLNSGIGDPSYATVSQVEDLKCDVSFREQSFTVKGEKAKALNKLINGNISKNQNFEPVSDAEVITLIFYSGDKMYSSDCTYYGLYRVQSDGKVGFTGTPYVSAILYYDSPRTLFEEVCVATGVKNN